MNTNSYVGVTIGTVVALIWSKKRKYPNEKAVCYKIRTDFDALPGLDELFIANWGRKIRH